MRFPVTKKVFFVYSSLCLLASPGNAVGDGVNAARYERNKGGGKKLHRALSKKTGKSPKASQTKSNKSSKGKSPKASQTKSNKSSKGSKSSSVFDGETRLSVEFEVDDSVCGSRQQVKEQLEAAFLEFFRKEYEDCGSGNEITSFTLVKWREADTCSSRRDLEAEGDENFQNSDSSQRRLTSVGIGEGAATCNNCGSGRSRRKLGSSSKGKSTGKSKRSRSECDVDLAEELQAVGFEDVEEAEVTDIEEVNCSPSSKQCTSTRRHKGSACCGIDGCACNVASESLCELNDCCVEVSEPFDPDFCEDYCDTSSCGSGDPYPY